MNNLELLICQITSLIEMYKQENGDDKVEKPSRKVGRPKKFDTDEERKKAMCACPSSSPVGCFRSGLLAVLRYTRIKLRGDNTVRHETC